LVKHSVASLSK
jgi:hypothetical protein